MRRRSWAWATGLAVTTGLGLAAGPSTAQPGDAVLGRWRTTAQNGVVEIERCGAALCGRLVDAAALRANPDQRDVRNRRSALRDRPIKGLVVLQDFSGGPQTWSGGPLYDPESGQSAATGRLTLAEPDRLTVQACVAPLLCRTQTWTRLR
ncbi:DUF2147 domain-containing protein [Brevundimonas diminuta]|uniref:DUF2147 domain-containing protein n=1 Tax=Brevundimonas diminuta TaxID=293 RepID=UPI002097A658|nr:DUF2147 domain-containing protein [Brevundimonas diminuta]MCO8019233.1 DUF2147 domain-containing protein [Brevundimonas diminuta]MCO8021910.1 DUF2147 domain-containing protein [Brevundimonas diminuta]